MRTNKKLWFGLSLGLFMGCWFLPIVGVQPSMPAFVMFLGLFDRKHFFEVLPMFGMLFFAFGLGAMLVGWLLQAVVILARSGRSG